MNLFPIRSLLFTPGINKKAILKCISLNIKPDIFVFDLEDSVSPLRKDEARDIVHDMIIENNFNRPVCIRLNQMTSEWINEDIKMINSLNNNQCNIHSIMFPKVESSNLFHDYIKQINKYFYVMGMIETPLGVNNSNEIGNINIKNNHNINQLIALVMGTSDLTKDLHAKHTNDRLPLLYSLSQCILAARVNNLAIIDGVHLNLSDEINFKNICKQGKNMGFDGKTLIHPKTIEITNNIFGPSSEEVELSKQIIQAFYEAEERGDGIVVVNDRLVENLHVENANRIIELNELIQNMK